MRADLLLRLADYLEKDAVNPTGFRFDIWTWAEPSINGDAIWRTVTDTPMAPEPNCGTTACAMGIAAISGIFKDEGLSYHIEEGGIFEFDYQGHWIGGFGTAQSLFEIDSGAAHFLFDGDYYRNVAVGEEMTGHAAELAVANRIRAFVRDDGKLATVSFPSDL